MALVSRPVWSAPARAPQPAIGYIGIPPEAIEKIGNEAGFRTELSKKQAGGIGLGMVYTRRVTEAHHGEMQIESEVGKGSIFRSLIPTAQP